MEILQREKLSHAVKQKATLEALLENCRTCFWSEALQRKACPLFHKKKRAQPKNKPKTYSHVAISVKISC